MAKTRFSHPAFSKDLKPLHGHLVDFQLGVAGGSGSLGGLIGFGHEKFSDLVGEKAKRGKGKTFSSKLFPLCSCYWYALRNVGSTRESGALPKRTVLNLHKGRHDVGNDETKRRRRLCHESHGNNICAATIQAVMKLDLLNRNTISV